MSSLKDFKPKRLAALETKMWRAYYGHNFGQLIILLVRLFKEQFGVNLIVALQLGYHSGKAAAIFRKSGDQARTLQELQAYFQLLNKHAGNSFDSNIAAQQELEWWLIHRYPKKYKQTLAKSLAAAMATIYNLPAESLQEHADYRAKAMGLRDKATHVDKTEPNWIEIEGLLIKSYQALYDTVNNQS